MSSYYEPESMHDLILHTEELYASVPFLYSWHGADFTSATYATFISDVRRAADWFIAHGYKDKSIMLFGKNSYEWLVCYVAITAYVGVCVGASKDWKHYDLDRAIEVSVPDVIIFDESLREFTTPFAAKLAVFPFSGVVVADGVEVKNNPRYDALARKKTDNAVIVFTTGTTSLPKATPLTLANMFANGESLYSRTQLTKEDVLYMFLPMHHIYSQVCVSMAAFLVGAKLYIAHDLNNLEEELRLCQPTMLSGVPLFFERVLGAINPADMRKIKQVAKVLHFFHASAQLRKKIFKKIHDVFGGRLKTFTSGGAPLDFATKQLLRDMGFVVVEGYGMSEASGVVSAEVPGESVPRSVGKVLENIEVKIKNPAADGYGELLIRGRNVTAGYINKGVVDTSCFDEDGYYKTNDEGYMDEGRNLFVRGRMGKAMVLSSGENISVDEMSLLIKTVAHIDKVYLSERDGYLEATLFTHETKEAIADALDTLNAELPRYKHLQKWTIINDYTAPEMK